MRTGQPRIEVASPASLPAGAHCGVWARGNGLTYLALQYDDHVSERAVRGSQIVLSQRQDGQPMAASDLVAFAARRLAEIA